MDVVSSSGLDLCSSRTAAARTNYCRDPTADGILGLHHHPGGRAASGNDATILRQMPIVPFLFLDPTTHSYSAHHFSPQLPAR